MTNDSDRLRTASDALLQDLEALMALEDEKRSLSPDEPRTLELAAQIRELAARVLLDTKEQEVMAQSIAIQAEIGDAPSIDDTPRSIPAILASWREAERTLKGLIEDSPEAEALRVHIDGLRDEYRRAHEERESKSSR